MIAPDKQRGRKTLPLPAAGARRFHVPRGVQLRWQRDCGRLPVLHTPPPAPPVRRRPPRSARRAIECAQVPRWQLPHSRLNGRLFCQFFFPEKPGFFTPVQCTY
ncbi:unnamed protein product, partial [Nesidiocoris tenuis]